LRKISSPLKRKLGVEEVSITISSVNVPQRSGRAAASEQT
jgi:hypothetical protein